MIWDTAKHNSTDLVQNQTLINSLINKNPTWTESDARKQIDEAWTIAEGYKKRKNKNKASEKKDDGVVDYGSVCDKCGGPVKRSGTCWVCYAGCGDSMGGCS